ncbi:hypothetical protein [Brevibacillus porteri]|uniref:hypothetical protein n=1 Tax=Brevibacillus porteri TaxID=2126350 RepID=UPI003D24E7B3
MSNEWIRSEIESNLKAKVASDPQLHNVYLLIHSEKLDIHWPIAAGNTDGGTANPNQPSRLVWARLLRLSSYRS